MGGRDPRFQNRNIDMQRSSGHIVDYRRTDPRVFGNSVSEYLRRPAYRPADRAVFASGVQAAPRRLVQSVRAVAILSKQIRVEFGHCHRMSQIRAMKSDNRQRVAGVSAFLCRLGKVCGSRRDARSCR
jgi:hypothetical protein